MVSILLNRFSRPIKGTFDRSTFISAMLDHCALYFDALRFDLAMCFSNLYRIGDDSAFFKLRPKLPMPSGGGYRVFFPDHIFFLKPINNNKFCYRNF